MALQMNKALTRYLAKFGILASVKQVVAGLDPVDRVEARAVAQMYRGAVIPIQPVRLHPAA